MYKLNIMIQNNNLSIAETISRQIQFYSNEVINDEHWSIDLESGVLKINSKEYIYNVLFIESANKYYWAWNYIRGEVPDEILDFSEKIRKIGQEKSIKMFCDPFVKDISSLELVSLSLEHLGHYPYFIAPSPNGDNYFLLLHSIIIDPYAIDRIDVLSDFINAYISCGAINNPKGTLNSFLAKCRKIKMNKIDSKTTIALADGGIITLSFDPFGFLGKIENTRKA